MALALACVSEHQFDLNPDSDALDFRPELVLVRDSLNRLVLTGQVWGAGIRWSEPITSDEEAAAVANQVDDLSGEASYEAGWDNYSMAEGLRLRARVLAGRLVDPFWQAPPRRSGLCGYGCGRLISTGASAPVSHGPAQAASPAFHKRKNRFGAYQQRHIAQQNKSVCRSRPRPQI